MKGCSAATEVKTFLLVIAALLISSTFGCPGAGFAMVTAVDGDGQGENAVPANEIEWYGYTPIHRRSEFIWI